MNNELSFLVTQAKQPDGGCVCGKRKRFVRLKEYLGTPVQDRGIIDYTEEICISDIQLAKQTIRKLLVLDLDETLVHTSFQPLDCYDFQLNIQIDDSVGAQVYTAYVIERPFVREFLQRALQFYDVAIFTASLKTYCDLVMERLDPAGKIQRFYRTECTFSGGVYLKDLKRFGRDLRDVVLVDNSQISCLLQPENSVVCPAFYDDKGDKYLCSLQSMLEALSRANDVREYIKEHRIELQGE